jgi:hypothetical protein
MLREMSDVDLDELEAEITKGAQTKRKGGRKTGPSDD